jgi:hypothetical protein
LASSATDERISNLRTNKLKPVRELWGACLFAHGIGTCVVRTELYVAPVEKQDYDCIMQSIIGDTRHFTPVQIKELVPERVNAATSLQAEIDKLEKYKNATDLVVAIHMNRQFHLDLDELRIPVLGIGELWLFGSISPDVSRLMLWGNLLKDPSSYEYRYPEA